ncbi:ComF family protein [Legionella fairfieldensis]|uniref:ComF family protein n=1 Tax=Legionella fairfieldensis TaxID=45064 RepID=UPI000A50AA27|nr:ComF family protein [Legionella fairfieldensis]
MRYKKASITQRLHLPSTCVLCQQYHRGSLAVCQLCIGLFKQLGPACHYCALPLPDAEFLICGLCAKERPVFDSVLTAYAFEEPLRTLLHNFKYQGALYLRSFLIQLMLDALPLLTTSAQCLIPVPLHAKRLQQRGFNQAAELARLLAKKLKLPCDFKLCKKIIHTAPQASLDSKQRQQNLHQAFQSKTTSYQHVILVDDLLTTGSTANELARVLKRQGVSRVDLWCCARTV